MKQLLKVSLLALVFSVVLVGGGAAASNQEGPREPNEQTLAEQLKTFPLILKGHTFRVVSSSFSPDGKRVVTASYDDTARIWDAETGKELRILTGHKGNVVSASFSPDGKRVVTASSDDTARIWDVETGKELRVGIR